LIKGPVFGGCKKTNGWGFVEGDRGGIDGGKDGTGNDSFRNNERGGGRRVVVNLVGKPKKRGEFQSGERGESGILR